MALTRIELMTIQAFLDSPQGSTQQIDALDLVIEMVDQREAMWADKRKK
jgi:hypothetical protein